MIRKVVSSSIKMVFLYLMVKIDFRLLATFLYLSYSIEQCAFTLNEQESHMVKSLKAGNENAYAKLFHEYYRPLTVFANKYLNDIESSKELVQDLFVSIYEKRKSILITTSLKTYLYQAARNRCLNQIKKNNIRRDYLKQADQNANSTESLEEQILANELEYEIFRIISQLSPKCQEVFTLSRVKGIKNQEIAGTLDISPRTVETHISNALKTLREKLGSKYDF